MARARVFGRNGLRTVLAWQVGRLVAKLALAAALAITFGRMIEFGTVAMPAVAVALVALALSAAAGLVGDLRLASAESAVAQGTRDDLRAKLEAMEARAVHERPAGALIAGLQRHPESLAALVVGHGAARRMLGIGTLLAAASVSVVSWQAALVLLVASPVMVIFFVLVGGSIQARAAAQEKALGQLAAQFEDRVRTLPTILASHGIDRETDKLQARMSAYAASTMGVLRVAFLNSGLIDFFSSLSIAVLAVFLGLGHLNLVTLPGFHDLQLWQSLFILMIAPEFFAPFRRYAEQYHAKAEGEAAAAAVDEFLDAADQAPAAASFLPRLARLTAETGMCLPLKGLVAVVGPSGAGKSTLLRRLAGLEEPHGRLPEGAGTGVDWISTDIAILPGSLAEVLSWNMPGVCSTRLLLAAGRIGLLDEQSLPGGLEARIAAGGGNLSGGQRLRVAIARALLSGRTILADEPNAKLDAVNAGRVRLALFDCARERLVVVATHDRELIGCADTVIDLGHDRVSTSEAAQ
ncbi:MAG: ATP-binding cassette domain-containing protein [Alphaproteobacteria bacterium]|nr:ATP-binding cassette domain-containing protein [Alphaproteobacteria bacterium]MBU0802373.1 ATP-binding cassette domain-containing protein [Alphaproteobacteria bacterium]MBU0870185.1 ATP-binding cassette domain-containing protein [Alphaproteobacteria bacterium]MBU1399872.1 ATP-binding cassette domain-containing protein [Alphaproteobacteria bacterium]MBU1590258.1 ATP-binding cassette domain-containing protein [Alphaproteobacteria bacterium]